MSAPHRPESYPVDPVELPKKLTVPRARHSHSLILPCLTPAASPAAHSTLEGIVSRTLSDSPAGLWSFCSRWSEKLGEVVEMELPRPQQQQQRRRGHQAPQVCGNVLSLSLSRS